MSCKSKKICIIGGGPAGISAAQRLSEEGFNVTLFEASDAVGGMSKSFQLWGQTVDLGPHRFFSNDPIVNEFWFKAVDGRYKIVTRLTRIFYKGKFFYYPLKPLNALFNLGIFEAIRCVLSYASAKIVTKEKDQNTFEGWVTNRFGKRLFSIFFKTYSEKLWGLSCKNLDADFAAQRIKKLSLLEVMKSAISLLDKKKHKTLVDEFAYPKGGAGFIYEKVATKIENMGGTIKLNCPVKQITLNSANSGIAVTLVNNETQSFDHLISTMPLTSLVKSLTTDREILAKIDRLKFRNTILVYLKLDGANPFPDQWLYIHSAEVLTGRITNFSNWVSDINNGNAEHIICLEYWANDNDKIWTQEDENLIAQASEDFKKLNLIKDNNILDGFVKRVPKCYPVYATGYKEDLRVIQNFMDQYTNITAIGRYGSFKYNNQDHSILMGLLAAENIIGNSSYNLWDLNTDYEYQESANSNVLRNEV